MTRYVALLRGINVGGHNKVPMAALRDICASVGCTDVATYIQSGNVVLTSSLDAAKLSAALESAIAAELGVAPAVVIRTHEQLAAIVAGNPFPQADPGHLHVLFLMSEPNDKDLGAMEDAEYPPEELAVRGADVYFHLPKGLGRAKLPELWGRRIKILGTMRNWRTVGRMLEMSAT
ncbi:MAG TPA: DUF1697 domain-containing protein [Actinophytocola sp.]|uniref:DUF1697 domain-containing protein n=1 Tax=Actinophytocola sp. TaxID=1872138 RepID=UPI002DDCD241|nr:DUF1697 domain-containing protein [Actinophytocola sp.]HEV2781409.1 DUF1697 domain-containing protein [Actinophytocola sp.]